MKRPVRPPPEEMSRDELLKEVAYLRAETDYLKTRCLDPGRAGGARRKAQAIQGLRQVHTLSLLLEAAELSRSTFYYQNHVPPIRIRKRQPCASASVQSTIKAKGAMAIAR